MTKPKHSIEDAEKAQEKLLTLKQAARVLNIPYRQLLSVSETGLFPCYQIGRSRKMVLASEVLASIRSTVSVKEKAND